jgi:tRNA (guanine37-N1)-methyltransferase
MFHGPLDLSILKRAQEKRTLTLDIMNIRDFAQDKYKTVDDRPYGGGKGMIMRVDVLDRALVEAKRRIGTKTSRTILLDPQGKQYSQTMATSLATLDALILVCGHYEGVDERVRLLVDEQLSIGDYVLTGGEIPAMVVVDSITRLIPGTLVSTDATSHESFQPMM